MSSLFRSEAIVNKHQRFYGNVLLTRGWSNTVLTAFFLVIIATLVAFATFFGFTQKATVQGAVVPSTGVIRILAQQPATITKIAVVEGSVVEVGDPLFVLSSETINENGGTHEAIKQSLASRIAHLNLELTHQSSQSSTKQQDLSARSASLSASEHQINDELALQREKVALARDVANRLAELARHGTMSKIAANEKAAELLEQESRLAAIEIQRQSIQRDISALNASRTDSSLQGTREASQMQREIEELRQRLTENEAKRQLIIRAEQAGRVAAITVAPGQAVQPNQRLASILPANSVLEAELYAPSCNDPAVPAQLKPLKQMPQRVFSCPVPDAGAGCCRTRSSR